VENTAVTEPVLANPEPGLMISIESTLPRTPTVNDAPAPCPPVNDTLGLVAYPPPGSVTVTSVTRPPEMDALALAARAGVPPVIVTAGVAWYPRPPSINWIERTLPEEDVVDAVIAALLTGAARPMGTTDAAEPSQRTPRPMPSTPYSSLYRPLNRVIGLIDPV
jgi:hypothetical protein